MRREILNTARISLFAALMAFLLSCEIQSRANPPEDVPAGVRFTKEFPESVPPYYSILIREDGAARLWWDPEEEPLEFHVTTSTASRVLQLAQDLHYFRKTDLESNRKVARMGKKTFQYEQGNQRNQVSFNHTEAAPAMELTSLFERLAQTHHHRDRLEHLLRFDRLGVVKELLQVESALNKGRLLEPTLLLPALEKIRADQKLVHVAQGRAGQIISKIQNRAFANSDGI
jgi:hypothetical protein